MLFLVEGTVRTAIYGGGDSFPQETRIVEADDELQACQKFEKHFNDKTIEYAVYVRCLNSTAHAIIT